MVVMRDFSFSNMKTSEFEKGMSVRVSENISKTTAQYTANSEMRLMVGKVFPLAELSRYKNGGFIEFNGNTYVFSLYDLNKMKMQKPKPPVMFDPKNLER